MLRKIFSGGTKTKTVHVMFSNSANDEEKIVTRGKNVANYPIHHTHDAVFQGRKISDRARIKNPNWSQLGCKEPGREKNFHYALQTAQGFIYFSLEERGGEGGGAWEGWRLSLVSILDVSAALDVGGLQTEAHVQGRWEREGGMITPLTSRTSGLTTLHSIRIVSIKLV